MIVPTGSAFLATSTLGPTGTAGAAAACCAPAPTNIFLAITAVITAMTSAPTSRASFFTSMARSPPLEGLPEQPHKSGKLVKKALGENRETAECDRDSVRNLRPALALLHAVPGENAECQRAARKRGPDEKFECSCRREPQRQRRGELDVTAAHHPRVERTGEQREYGRSGRELHRDSRPRRERDRCPVYRRKQCNGEVQPIRNGESTDVNYRRHEQDRSKAGQQQIGKCAVEHGRTTRRRGFPIRNRWAE